MAARRAICWTTAILVSVLIAASSPAFCAASDDEARLLRCAAVKPGVQFEFRGHPLLETPDIDEPDLRLINALLSAQCFDQSARLIDQFRQAHPDDYHVMFVTARLQWMIFSQPTAQLIIETTLRAHPDFSSMKILLASMNIDAQDLPAAAKLLDEVEKAHPEDLWLFMDRLRIEANLAATADTMKTLAAIMADAHFPPSARTQALRTAQNETNNLSVGQRDELFAEGMDAGVGNDCDLVGKATDLIELRNEPAAGASLIEKSLRKSGGCSATPSVRALLAEAYLLAAAKIAVQPVAANATLIRQAKETLGGDLMPVARRVAVRPFLSSLLPLLAGSMDVQATDDDGNNLICSAIEASNPAMVKAQLIEGAEPNGKCSHDQSLVQFLLAHVGGDYVAERQLVLRHLLERGARVEMLDSCANPDNGNCRTVFLPILKEFDDRRAQTRESL